MNDCNTPCLSGNLIALVCNDKQEVKLRRFQVGTNCRITSQSISVTGWWFVFAAQSFTTKAYPKVPLHVSLVRPNEINGISRISTIKSRVQPPDCVIFSYCFNVTAMQLSCAPVLTMSQLGN